MRAGVLALLLTGCSTSRPDSITGAEASGASTATLVAEVPSPITTETAAATPTENITMPDSTEIPDSVEMPDSTAVATIATETPAPTAPDTTIGSAECRRLTDFTPDDPVWVVVNDGVMGGRSDGVLEVTNSVMRFSGTVVTQGGGFTSVRLRLNGGELAGTTRVELRVRSDQRTYGLTFNDAAITNGRSVAHRADLSVAPEVDSDGWGITTLSFDELSASVFGRSIEAAPFDPAGAQEIGIIIADAVDGPFVLEVDWIDACQ
ncbi:MAG: hypothetical protein ACJAR2_000279 [Ilumatobacter sp.]|jgi:NADH dehydrogenase [ubiquinone] 1 alpha subcomplex assembly factor 1